MTADPPDNNNNLPPLNKVIIAQINYMQDGLLYLPVALNQKEENFYLKSPVAPLKEWNIKVNFNSLDFNLEAGNIDIKLFRNPFDKISYWTTSILNKVLETQDGNIYYISNPVFAEGHKARKEERFFLITDIKCYFAGHVQGYPAKCVDISQNGLGIKVAGKGNVEAGTKLRIKFMPPYQQLPEVEAIIRSQNFNPLDNTTSFGLEIDLSSKKHMQPIIEEIIKKQRSDAFSFSTQVQAKLKRNQQDIFNLFQF